MTAALYHPFRSSEAQAEYLAHYAQEEAMWPIPSVGQLVETSYGRTFVRISGPIDAPPLVLFPGAGGCSLQWRLNIEALSHRYRTYAVDGLINLGCVGRSVYSRAISHEHEAVAWLDELFDGLDLGNNLNLMGPSHGGWLAAQYALHAPDRLDGLVLVAPAGIILPFRKRYLFRTILLSIFPSRDRYIRFFKWSFKDLAQINSQFIEAMADDFLLSVRCFEPVNPRELPKLTALSDEELQRISVPTLVLMGENEVLYSAQEAVKRLKKSAPQIAVELLPNAGHDLLLVQAEMVHQKIEGFLSGILRAQI